MMPWNCRRWFMSGRLMMAAGLVTCSAMVFAAENLKLQPVDALPQTQITPATQTGRTAPASLAVNSVSPAQITQGIQTNLTISGTGFRPGIEFDFGPGVSIVVPAAFIGDNRAVVRVLASQAAAPGSRPVKVSVPAPVGIADVGAKQSATGPATLTVLAALPPPPSPAPGGGFTDKIGSDTLLAAPPAAAAPAPSDALPGAADGGKLFRVAPALSIQGVQPNVLTRGESYTLAIKGQGLSSGMQMDLGSGIKATGALKVTDAMNATLQVAVDDKAPSGMRNVKTRVSGAVTWNVQNATVMVMPKKGVTATGAKLVVTPKIAQTDFTAIPKGSIKLLAPQWRSVVANAVPPKGPDGKPLGPPTPIYQEHIPTVHDDLLFTWQEQNPGLAERFEVRFYVNGKLARSVSIKPMTFVGKGKMLPTWYRPTGQVLAEVLAAMPGKNDKFGLQVVNTAAFSVPGDLQGALAKADITWEVAGFRTYNKSGLTKSAQAQSDQAVLLAANTQSVMQPGMTVSDAPALGGVAVPVQQEVEVETSERWPLFAPDRPTGMTCGMEKGGLALTNIDQKSDEKGKGVELQAANNTGDRFKLSGTLDLAKSPYKTHADTSKPTATTGVNVSTSGFSVDVSEQKSVLYTSWAFENVFVDWGDGAVTPLKVMQWGDQSAYKNGMPIPLDVSMIKYQHAYQAVGQYTVRVYQISSDDVQTGGHQVASLAMGDATTLYGQAISLGGAQTNAPAPENLGVAKAVADRAYMLFCDKVKIQPRVDPDANGPLHLVSIEVQGFPGGPSGQLSPVPTEGALLLDASSVSGKSPGAGGAKGQKTGSVKDTLNLEAVTATPVFALDQDGLPKFTACDYSITPGAKLGYYGQGKARLRWRHDGASFYEETIPVPPSRGRDDAVLKQDSKSWGAPLVDFMAPLQSSAVNLEQIGKHQVVVEAEVVPDLSQLYVYAEQALGVTGAGVNADAAKAMTNALKQGQKVGVLSPFKTSSAGLPPVSYLNEPLEHLAQRADPIRLAALNFQQTTGINDLMLKLSSGVQMGPPHRVVSDPRDYRVVGHDSSQPCTFEFPVQGGNFMVVGLQEPGSKKPKVTHQGNVFQGKGDLLIHLPDQNGALKQTRIPLTFSHWTVSDDGVRVESGAFSVPKVSMGQQYLPGLTGSVSAIAGTAGDRVDATLNVKLAHPQLTYAAAPGTVPAWINVKAPLSPQGDWYAANVPVMGDTLIYDTPFTLKPQTVTLDLSAVEGAGADAACAGKSGAGWMGVHLGQAAKVSVYDFNLPGEVTASVDNWGIDGAGLCGKGSAPAVDMPLFKGRMRWKSVDMSANSGNFSARYTDMKVRVPWLDAELKGATDPVIKKDGVISLALAGNAPPKQFGPVTMEGKNLLFTTEPGIGPVARGDTRFDFAGENKVFASDIWVNDLLFGFDGRAYLPGGGTSKVVDLNGKSGFIAGGIANHTLVNVSTGGSERLRFDFSSTLKISEQLPAAKAAVSYYINEMSDATYLGYGPFAKLQPITKPFPDAQPSVTVTVEPSYVGAGTTAAIDPPFLLAWVPEAQAASSGIRFYGKMDMGMFDNDYLAGVTGEFLLGYVDDDDYWATKVVKNLTPGIPVSVPPVLYLNQIGGGLGYNVALNVCEGADISSVTPKIDHQPAFFAQAMLGSADGFAYNLRGCLTVKKSGARMDYDAWLLNKASDGIQLTGKSTGKKGDFYGYFQYAGGAFDGTMNGKYSFLNDAAYVEAANDAVRLHFSGAKGYVNVGSKQNPVTGHVLIIDANAYLGVDIYPMPAFRVGAKTDNKYGGCLGPACGYVNGKVAINAEVTAKPSISYESSQKLSVEGCLEGECVSAGVSTDIKGSALPPYFYFGASFGGCPTPDASVGLRILPSIKPDISIDWCGVADVAGDVIDAIF